MSPSELPREILVSGDRDSDGQYHGDGDGDGNDDGFPVTGGMSSWAKSSFSGLHTS